MTAVPNDAFRPLESPDFRMKMSIAHVEGESSTYMKCEVIIDASPQEVAAYGFKVTSRKKVKFHDRKDYLHQDATSINNHALDYIWIRDLGVG